MRQPCVYIMASKRNGTLYIGTTSDLVQRVWQHKIDIAKGFTKRYGIHTLVWFEGHNTMLSAIERDKKLKERKPPWKLELIESSNPSWRDLTEDLA